MCREGTGKFTEFAYRNCRFSEVMVHWLGQLMLKAQTSVVKQLGYVLEGRERSVKFCKLKRHFVMEKQSKWLHEGYTEFYSG